MSEAIVRRQFMTGSLATILLAVVSSSSRAQAGMTDRTATDIIRSLAPIDNGAKTSRPAGDLAVKAARANATLVRQVAVPALQGDQPAAVVDLDLGHALDFDVFFAYDSDRLDGTATAYLAPLGEALASAELAPYRFLLAGNTDAAGRPDYNRALSLRRARSVRDHLASVHRIAPGRLLVAGFGSDYLRDAAHPLSAVNRRVEVFLVLN